MKLSSSCLWLLSIGSAFATVICETCIPIEVQTAPGVGIDLTMDYGTAALRLHNGTMIDIARIDGSPAYLSTMRTLAADAHNISTGQNSSLPYLPYYPAEPKVRLFPPGIFFSLPRLYHRLIQESQDLFPFLRPSPEPITDPHILAISSMFSSLHSAITAYIGHDLVTRLIVLTIPDFFATPSNAYHSRLHIAAENAKFSITPQYGLHSATEVTLEYHTVPLHCFNEDPFWPETNIHCDSSSSEKIDTVLSVTYTSGSLSATLLHRIGGSLHTRNVREDGGLGADSKLREQDSALYWKEVRGVVETVIGEEETIDHLEILGTMCDDGALRNLIKQILGEKGCGGTVDKSLHRPNGKNGAYAAAEAGAEIARDLLRGLYDGCEYPAQCMHDAL